MIKPLVALDGHAAAGSGTACRAISEHFDIPHIDVGRMYRELALRVEAAGFRIFEGMTITQALKETVTEHARLIDGETFPHGQLYSDSTGVISAIISPIEEGRHVIRERQKALASSERGVVMEGRDITSVIMRDNAHCRLFLTADLDCRAQRRCEQLVQRGQTVDFRTIRDEIAARDSADESRPASPLVCLPGVIRIDNSSMTAQQTQLAIVSHVQRAMEALSI